MSNKDAGLLKIGNIVAYVVTLIVNGLAGSTTIIGGKLTADISDANPTLITPAGYVFAIWGVIYILLGAFVIYQALPSQKGKDYHSKIGWLFILSCAANICWLFLWQFQYIILSVVLMLVLLASLLMIYLRLDIGISTPGRNERLTIHLPFSVYLGWITVATIANISAAFVSIGQLQLFLGEVNWAVFVLIVALLITGVMLWTRRDLAYAAVLVWALVGIYAKHTNVVPVAYTSLICAGIIIADAVLVIVRKKPLKDKQ
jgi:benzodiazapine receptor